MNRALETVENAVKPTRSARVHQIVDLIGALSPDGFEATEIVDALAGALKYGFDDADLVDVLDRAAGLRQSLEELDHKVQR